jgi:predicted DNA-binding transcriptional regulator AlpA
MEDLITKKEASGLLGVSEKTLDRRVKEGAIHPIRFSERIVKYSLREIQAYIEQKSTGVASGITLTEAEKIVRSVLSGYHFDEDTSESLTKVADLLATLRA